jgi:hypothetical protein
MTRIVIRLADGGIARPLVTHGQPQGKAPYEHISLPQAIGQTVEAIAADTIEGPDGDEPITYLLFANRTAHGFVHPSDID